MINRQREDICYGAHPVIMQQQFVVKGMIDVRVVFVVWRGYSHPPGPQVANKGNKTR